MRSFIAIELPAAIQDQLGGLCGRLRASSPKASWVRGENMHVTLRFLGEVTEEDLARLSAMLSPAYQACEGVTLRVCGIGAFPNLRRPSVVWAGLEIVQGAIEPLHAQAEQAARMLGLPPETKRFHPHVTLARLRDPRGADALTAELNACQSFHAGEFRAESVSLFSSELRRGGAVYRRLEEFFFS